MKWRDILQVLSEGIILFLAPAAILKTMSYWVDWDILPLIITVLNMMTCGYIGYKLAEGFSGTKIAAITGMVVVLITSNSISLVDGVLVTKLGDLVTAVTMGVITGYSISWFESRFGAYRILLVTPVSAIVLIPFGLWLYQYVSKVVLFIAHTIETFTELQPFLMGGLLAVCFGLLIVSPFSSVAVASILGVSGIVAGSASFGVIMMGMCLFLASLPANGVSRSFAILIGSPKIMMNNVFQYPKLLIPIIGAMFAIGSTYALLGVESTTQGAGFGAVGFVGFVDFFIKNPSFSIVQQWLLVLVLPLTVSTFFVYTSYIIKFYEKQQFELNINI